MRWRRTAVTFFGVLTDRIETLWLSRSSFNQ
ncbi:hypothetical protein F441_12702 [Phytophthora nicotianae CJ01A1]|uniref:Uncharacterized protein n=1 Tax=Phytophthora nicotianae CJ01A1 TaxID=1317063 RepID=W2WMQ0_PHYNI|nr:hypothetical protein F441_12702 [Phytophthora nicotianae CJ01A1]